RAILWINRHDGFDRALGFSGASERQQAEHAILLNGTTAVGEIRWGTKPVQYDQRVFVRRSGVQVARRCQGILRRQLTSRQKEETRRDRGNSDRSNCRFHFFLKSTLSRAGTAAVTVIA